MSYHEFLTPFSLSLQQVNKAINTLNPLNRKMHLDFPDTYARKKFATK